MLTLSGAYGRDYTSKAGILADLNAGGRDFVIRTFGPDDGRYVTGPELVADCIKQVMVRYKADRQVAVVKYTGEAWK